MSKKYEDRAVFTARIVQLMGRTYGWDGKKYSSLALAVVQKRYWGLPWYWPKVVLLDGSYPCDIAMTKDEEYLVSGRKGRYGMLEVNLCSRTQPLKTAQLDLRTIEGTNCAAPGGALLGHVMQWGEKEQKNSPVPNVALRFKDSRGNSYSSQTDGDGIYELRHLKPGEYTLDSRLGPNQYLSSNAVDVPEGECVEVPVRLSEYRLSGRLVPGISGYVAVKLVATNGAATELAASSIEPDGTFYFSSVRDGDYVLSVTSWVEGTRGEFFYPGTFERSRAKRIRVTNGMSSTSLDFDPKRLPLVPITVAIESSPNAGRFSWSVRLASSSYILTAERWAPGIQVINFFGVRGGSYTIDLYGFSPSPTEYGDCRSEPIHVSASSTPDKFHIAIPARCE